MPGNRIHPLLSIIILSQTVRTTAPITVVASCSITPRLLHLTAATTSGIRTAHTRRTDVAYTHTTGKQSDSQEKTDNEYGNGHEYPGERFKTGEAKSLKYAGS